MIDKPTRFERKLEAFAQELEDAERRAAADDDLMAAALRGEPFWGAGKAPVSPEQIVGLADFVPGTDPVERYAFDMATRANGCNSVFPIDDPRPRPIERYVRAQVAIGWMGNPIIGRIELGMHYADGSRPRAFRSKLIEIAKCGYENVFRDRIRADEERWPHGEPGDNPLDEDVADTLTRDIDKRILGLWGDRPRFIEVWRGDDDDEPLTQIYAPHGMPRWR